jgi:hypothetical protein
MSTDKKFSLFADVLESSDDLTYEVLMQRKGKKYEFVSSYLIDFNGNDKAYYNKEIIGLIVKDSIPQMPNFKIGDNIVSLNSVTHNKSSDFLVALKENLTDTLHFLVLRDEVEMEITFTMKDVVSRPSEAFWTDLEDVLSYNLQPSLYNPELFEPFYVVKDLIIKDDEFSSPHLEIDNFKAMVANRLIDSNKISFEFYKNEQLSYPDFTNNTHDYFYLFSKVGTPVFTAFDPNPYDPLHERDTLITGSLTEVKTNGNWK